MNKNFLLSIFILLVSLSVVGCDQPNNTPSISEFSISHLEIQDDRYLVGNEVLIQAQVENANKVQLIVQDQGQNDMDTTIEGKKFGDHWEFTYKNNDSFTKEIWLVAYGDSGEKIQSDKRIITNQDQSYESAFENIIPVSTEEKNIIDLTKHTGNLNIFGWYDNQNLLAQNNNNLILYNIANDKKQMILQNVWNVYVNPKLEYVIYQKENGVYFSAIGKKNTRKIFDMADSSVLKDLVWSRDQEYVILNIMKGKENLYYRIDLKGDDSKAIQLDSLNQEQYTLEQIIYLENNNLYALGRISAEDDNHGETERPITLLRINIATGKINKNYTPKLEPLDEINILSQVNDREFLVRVSTKIVSEEETQSFNDIYLLNTQNGIFKKIKTDVDYPYVYSLSSNKDRYIYLKDVVENGSSISNKKSIVLGKKNGKEEEILEAINFFPTSFHWSENGEKIAFYMKDTKEIYLIERKSQ